jgi:ketosteroid isomerase-like protein
MSPKNLEMVREAVAALNHRDVDRYLACCTDDVQLLPPTVAVEGVYEGPSGVRRFFADVQDAVPDFRLDLDRLEAIGPDRVMAFFSVAVSGRASGVGVAFPTTTIYDFADGKVNRVRVFLDRASALEPAGLSE